MTRRRRIDRFVLLLAWPLLSSVKAFTLLSNQRSSLERSSNDALKSSASITEKEDALNAEKENVTPNRLGGISLSLEELSEALGGMGRAKICWDLYSIGVDPDDYFGGTMAESDREEFCKMLPSCRRTQNLSSKTLERLASLYPQGRVEGGVASLSLISISEDLTTKLLLKLADGLEVETVIIPWEGVRSTLCISSQVGCSQGCKFCATGRMGKLRSLTCDEIVAQMFFAKKIARLNNLPKITNIVFMGLGEPSDNADNVVRATQLLTSRGLFQLSASKTVVSTVAPTPDSFGLFQKAPCVLAWSVHAVNDALRKRLVPTTNYSMRELRQGLIDALNARPLNLRTVMLEVVLLKGVNDDLDHADELAAFSQVIIDSVEACKLVINVIPYNPIDVVSFEKPSKEACTAFQQRLQYEHGLYAFVRVTRGDDESAACGQLTTTAKREKQSSQPKGRAS
ncbi:RNA methyltransferase RlmN [Seminavis robusta]|uniref:RNA methyltransferase RlmN n=1 Tax=Seminavis robusta TaxID=568900 RepID=A0A9N8HPZ9_9STRA|nr:RNA methyltransferase RlmN [Seminavis robusta]|eukprot:Sro1121_g243450.1 RNA methyltransferase RlmN (455) ;mRNA; r:30586-32086